LSETIKEALGGTDTVDAKADDVPEPAAAELYATVVFTALVPSTLAATIMLTLKTLPDEAELASKTLDVVFAGVKTADFAVIVATETILGAAILSSFN